MSSHFDVSGKVVCVAGASRGLGEAIARAFAEHGASGTTLTEMSALAKLAVSGLGRERSPR